MASRHDRSARRRDANSFGRAIYLVRGQPQRQYTARLTDISPYL
jgi:hypothetical protein